MLKTIGQHVCNNTGNGALIEKSGHPPAKSLYDVNSKKNPFLGSGYYFWDYNIEMARYWGKNHYNNSYYIFQAEINCEENVMLDLVGNRRHIEWIIKLMQVFSSKNSNSARWSVGKFIEFLKEISQTDEKYKDILPYKSIRAVDHRATIPNVQYSFDESSSSFITMNPRIIVCIIDISPATLTNFKLIETK